MKIRTSINGQSIFEYCVLSIIVVASLIVMQGYVKRGFQGRWKSAVDDLGDQYDPRKINSVIRYTSETQGNSSVRVIWNRLGNGDDASYTLRDDITITRENKTGLTQVETP